MSRDVSDDALWRLLQWKPHTPEEQRRMQHVRTAHAVAPRDQAENRPSDRWIAWAKSEVLAGPERGSADDAYVCRLLRLLEPYHDGGVDEQVLRAAVLAGVMMSGESAPSAFAASRDVAVVIERAGQQGLIARRDVDDWHAGMRSGSGWRGFLTLTQAGHCVAEQFGTMPDPWGADAAGEPEPAAAAAEPTSNEPRDSGPGRQIPTAAPARPVDLPWYRPGDAVCTGTDAAPSWRFEDLPDGDVLARNRELCEEYARTDMNDLLVLAHRWRTMAAGLVEAAQRTWHARGPVRHEPEVTKATKILQTAMADRKAGAVGALAACLHRPDDARLQSALAALDELEAVLRLEAARRRTASAAPSPQAPPASESAPARQQAAAVSEAAPAKDFWERFELFFDGRDGRYKLRELAGTCARKTHALAIGGSETKRKLLERVLESGRSRLLTHGHIRAARGGGRLPREMSADRPATVRNPRVPPGAQKADGEANRRQVYELNQRFAQSVARPGTAPPNAFQSTGEGWTWYFHVTTNPHPSR
jgi:hypothetical protein